MELQIICITKDKQIHMDGGQIINITVRSNSTGPIQRLSIIAQMLILPMDTIHISNFISKVIVVLHLE